MPGVQRVYLRGNALKNCVPAISDLDFTLVADIDPAVSAQRASILEWRRTYHKLKQTLWMLGEVVIEDPLVLPLQARTGSSFSLAEGERLGYQNGQWTSVVRSRPVVASQNRFLLSLNNFLKAQAMMTLFSSGRSRAFSLGRLHRHLHKVIYFSRDIDDNKKESKPEALFAEAFWALDSLAASVNSAKEPLNIEIESRLKGSPESHTPLSERQDFLASGLLRRSEFPGVYLSETEDKEGVTLLFFDYLGASWHFHQRAGFVPLVLPPNVYSCYLKGWNNQFAHLHLAAIPSKFRKDPNWVQQLKWHLFQRLIERTLWQLAMLMGELTFAPVSYLKRAVSELALNAASLATGCLTDDIGLLSELCRARYPMMASFFKTSKVPNQIDELAECALSLRAEAFQSVSSVISRLALPNALSRQPKEIEAG